MYASACHRDPALNCASQVLPQIYKSSHELLVGLLFQSHLGAQIPCVLLGQVRKSYFLCYATTDRLSTGTLTGRLDSGWHWTVQHNEFWTNGSLRSRFPERKHLAMRMAHSHSNTLTSWLSSILICSQGSDFSELLMHPAKCWSWILI